MLLANLYAALTGLFLGCIAGIIPGLFFHKESWLGGYASWPRRLIRLAHISFFGIGFINLLFVLTVQAMSIEGTLVVPSTLLIIAAITMPLICYLAAYRKVFRNLFFIPALSLTIGIGWFSWRILTL